MKNHVRRRLRIACVAGILCLLALIFLAAVQEVHWVGRTDLTVEFVVTDEETGQPIRNAEIAIVSWGGFYEDGRRMESSGIKEERLTLTTDDTGIARYVCRHSMSFGTSGLFTNSYCVHLPEWTVTMSAVGFVPNEPFFLDHAPYRRAVKRVGPRQATLVVPIALRKSP